MNSLPVTTARLRILHQSFAEQVINGEVTASDFEWQFTWRFSRGELNIHPSLGSALIEDSLLRFLLKADYKLEAGGDYVFTIRAKF